MAGLATAALTNPVPVPEFGAVGGNRGGSGEPWRRLVRRRPASQRRRGGGSDGDENGKGGREQRANRRNVVVIEREISCGYSDAVGELLTASHGEAVRVVAAGVNGNGKGLKEEDLLIDTSLASATGSSAGLLKGWLIDGNARKIILLFTGCSVAKNTRFVSGEEHVEKVRRPSCELAITCRLCEMLLDGVWFEICSANTLLVCCRLCCCFSP